MGAIPWQHGVALPVNQFVVGVFSCGLRQRLAQIGSITHPAQYGKRSTRAIGSTDIRASIERANASIERANASPKH